jgi:hypothetical protein
MSDQNDQNKKESNFLRTVLIAVICIPIIIWLLYNAYQKSQESGEKTTACEKMCTDQGYSGYQFQWPMLSAPKCSCIGSRQ